MLTRHLTRRTPHIQSLRRRCRCVPGASQRRGGGGDAPGWPRAGIGIAPPWTCPSRRRCSCHSRALVFSTALLLSASSYRRIPLTAPSPRREGSDEHRGSKQHRVDGRKSHPHRVTSTTTHPVTRPCLTTGQPPYRRACPSLELPTPSSCHRTPPHPPSQPSLQQAQ